MYGLPHIFPTVVHMLTVSAERWPDREALVCGDDRLTYRQYFSAVAGMSAELRKRGAVGKRVALVMTNSVDICISMFAVHAAGAQAVPLNPLYTATELEPILADAQPHMLIYDDQPAEAAAAVANKLGIRNSIHLGEAAKTRAFDFDADELHAPLPDASDLATLQYTGGTTGVSKGVNLSHRNIAVNISQREALLTTPNNGVRILSVLPLFHVYGVAMCLHNAVYAGAALIILPRFTAEAAFKLLADENISILAGSPTVFTGLMAHEQFGHADFSHLSLSYSGSAPLAAALLQQWEDATGAPVLEGYGQSEAGPVISFNPLNGTRKAASVGIALPETELEIVDTNNGLAILPAGQPGEIRLRGPQTMQGYRNRPADTASALRDGWLYTGDIGMLDDEGYLYIQDRKNDMIIVSGYNVYPREIEELLQRHPDILESTVIGIPDSYRGEIPRAYIVPAANCRVTSEQLDGYCREHLAAYKTPRSYIFLDSLPKTAVGKVDKLALRTEAVDS